MIELADFSDLPFSLQAGAVVRFLEPFITGHPSKGLVDDIVHYLRSNPSCGRIDLPERAFLEIAYGEATIRHKTAGKRPFPKDPLPLTIPGKVEVPESGLTITAYEGRFCGKLDGSGRSAFLSAKKAGSSLWVRRRRQGDRFRPLGMKKEKKLKDFLIDRKVPRETRDRIPLIVDEGGRILWVAGIEISQDAALDKAEGEAMVIFRIEGDDPRL